MTSEVETIDAVESAALSELASASEPEALEAWRVRYLGRKGRLTQLLRTLPQLPIEERKVVGAQANAVKDRLEAAHEERLRELEESRLARVIESERLDVTLPGPPLPRGRLHPVTQTLREMLDAFLSMGFQVVEGPEVESDYYNFEALRIPADHPARDM